MHLADRASIASHRRIGGRTAYAAARLQSGHQAVYSGIQVVAVAVFIAGFYLHHNLYLTDSVFVPTYLATLAGLGLLVFNANRLPENFITFVLAVIAICLASILCNPMFWLAWASPFGVEYAKSFVVFLSVIFASMGVCVGVLHIPRRVLRRLLWLFVYVVVIGSILDVTVPAFRSLFQQISSPFLRFGFEYVNEIRDVQMYGSLRPKFLTSEPSNVSIFLVFAFTLLHLLGKSDTSLSSRVHFWGVFAVALLVVRGPTLALVPIFALLFSRLNFALIFVGAFAVLILSIVVLMDSDVVAALAKSRIGWVLEGNDRSFFVRQVLPVQVAWETISQFPAVWHRVWRQERGGAVGAGIVLGVGEAG